ncbi:hypothetical protein ACWD5Q_35510 [Streptomyces sp. NPDC002513]
MSRFTELAAVVPEMSAPLTALSGMRQSCPEDHFEIAGVPCFCGTDRPAEELQAAYNLVQTFQQIKGVGPYTTVITGLARIPEPCLLPPGRETSRSSPDDSSTSKTPHRKPSPTD